VIRFVPNLVAADRVQCFCYSQQRFYVLFVVKVNMYRALIFLHVINGCTELMESLIILEVSSAHIVAARCELFQYREKFAGFGSIVSSP